MTAIPHSVSVATPHSSHARELRADVAAACARIAPAWPLDRFLAVNPLWGYLDRPLPEVAAGELLAVFGVGAYGFTMSSTYNARPRPPEVLVDGARFAVARRRETYDDLVAAETATPTFVEAAAEALDAKEASSLARSDPAAWPTSSWAPATRRC